MNRRDIELLSAYLDGELKPADSAKIEKRLKSDLELDSALSDLRSTRSLLRRLPMRKAPRNFTLTRRMVGQNPPLPRSYSFFSFATSFAVLLLFFSFAANAVSYQSAQPLGFGRGGGNGTESEAFAEAPAMEEPAAPAPAEAAMPEAPAAPAEPAADNAEPSIAAAQPLATAMPTEEVARIMETPSQKNGEGNAMEQTQPSVPDESLTSPTPVAQPFVSKGWQIGLALAAVVGALLMLLMKHFSANRWK